MWLGRLLRVQNVTSWPWGKESEHQNWAISSFGGVCNNSERSLSDWSDVQLNHNSFCSHCCLLLLCSSPLPPPFCHWLQGEGFLLLKSGRDAFRTFQPGLPACVRRKLAQLNVALDLANHRILVCCSHCRNPRLEIDHKPSSHQR